MAGRTPLKLAWRQICVWQGLSDEAVQWTTTSISALAVSCLLGCGISYFAFSCRKSLSATAFTVVG